MPTFAAQQSLIPVTACFDVMHTDKWSELHNQPPLATIRNSAKELITLGDAIVKLGVPAGTKEEKVESFKKGLEDFSKALFRYGADAESGSDANLKKSYEAVHESFEELAEMLPK